jgi:hypothetical protein
VSYLLRFDFDFGFSVRLHLLFQDVFLFCWTFRGAAVWSQNLDNSFVVCQLRDTWHVRMPVYEFSALSRPFTEINQRAADMWSYAILLWELATREVPFAELSPMEVGMKVKLL